MGSKKAQQKDQNLSKINVVHGAVLDMPHKILQVKLKTYHIPIMPDSLATLFTLSQGLFKDLLMLPTHRF